MSYFNQFFDAVKHLFNTNANKAILIGMSEEKRIVTVGAGDLQTAEAIVMLGSTLGNTYLEMSPERKAEYPVAQMVKDLNQVILNRIAAVDPTLLAPTPTPEPVAEVAEVTEEVAEPVVKPKRTRAPRKVVEEATKAPVKRARKGAK